MKASVLSTLQGTRIEDLANMAAPGHSRAAWDPETCWFNEGLFQPCECTTAHFQMEKLRPE